MRNLTRGAAAGAPAGTRSPSAGPGGPTAGPAGATPRPPDACRSGGPYAEALLTGRGPLFLRREDGMLLPLDIERLCAPPDPGDLTVLERCDGRVLDIGCGPGRLVTALGTAALGIDVCPAAVARTARSGGTALRRSVFEQLPDEGRWNTALLVDGNLGIGGDPHRLLERAAHLVRPRGTLVAEPAPHEVEERHRVRVTDGHGRLGEPFPWARVGLTALLRRARETGWAPVERWTVRGRTFVALRRAD